MHIKNRPPTSEEIISILQRIDFNEFLISDVLKLFCIVELDDIKECWLRGKDWSTYSTIKIDKITTTAHRYSFQIFNGPLKAGQEICHTCDRKGCINPKHLFQGTHTDNVKDAIKKGRIFKISLDQQNKIDNFRKQHPKYSRVKAI